MTQTHTPSHSHTHNHGTHIVKKYRTHSHKSTIKTLVVSGLWCHREKVLESVWSLGNTQSLCIWRRNKA